jgi:hypothetical protein
VLAFAWYPAFLGQRRGYATGDFGVYDKAIAMDVFSKLKFATIPAWSRYLFLAILLLIGAVNTGVFLLGLVSGKDGWVASSIQLLSAFLPIFTILYVALHVRYGDNAINVTLNDLYSDLLPRVLSQIDEPESKFRLPAKHEVVKLPEPLIEVMTNHIPGRIEADFRIRRIGDGRTLYIRLEVNYRRINFNLYMNRAQIEEITGLKRDDLRNFLDPEVAKAIIQKLGHSVGGARFSSEPTMVFGKEERTYQSAYSFNTNMIWRELNDEPNLCIVAMKSVAPEFIWDAGERSYFAFDLMLMLRAMVDECPSICRYEEDAKADTKMGAVAN